MAPEIKPRLIPIMLAALVFTTLLFGILLFSACQTFPPGERLEGIAPAAAPSGPRAGAATAAPAVETPPGSAKTPAATRGEPAQPQVEFSICRLYRYFTMCRAVWKIRDSYKDAEWELDYFYDEPTNTLGLAVLEDEVLHIVFRSSQAPKDKVDLKYNLRISKIRDDIFPNSDIRAHRGFVEKYHAIRPQILQRIEAADTRRVLLIGHSGGAALAGIAFMDLHSRYPQLQLDGITFGMVRVFNHYGQEWFEQYNSDFLRIVNGRDPFPNLPPALFGYRHVGRLIRIGKRPWYKIFSAYDHYHGYRKVLEELLIEAGVEPGNCY